MVGLWKYCDSYIYGVIPFSHIFGYRGVYSTTTSLLGIWLNYHFPQSRISSQNVFRVEQPW